MKPDFESDFLWGASTSAHQVEGGNNNDWTQWEKLNAAALAAEGKSSPAREPNNYLSGQAADHYHRYEADLDLAQSIGLRAYRFSIEWSRIEPEPGRYDQAELAHYGRVIAAARKRNIEPLVCLWHWTLPVWLSDRGGWSKRANVKHYIEFVRTVSTALGPKVKFWLTLNEPEVYAFNVYMLGNWLSKRHNPWLYFHSLGNMIRGHRAAYRLIKAKFPEAQVGLADDNIYFDAFDRKWVNRIAAAIGTLFWNHLFMDRIRKQTDFIGLNYYHHVRVDYWRIRNEERYRSDMGWELYPRGLYFLILNLQRRYHKPIYITEHGLADASDKHRAWYITESLKQVKRAMDHGADVRGYLHWSLIDNFEWDSGFWPRFGLIAVDYQTQTRTVRPSARILSQIIQSGRIE
ncbi:MAG TPA: glycoside hydrolase family 1 protein [Candidatus Saccharimonadales bacterium]|nr:glycoside hydrolase family 1 protein [Candidatus Saccharimonadales bacterium]